jgi:phosphomannomutase
MMMGPLPTPGIAYMTRQLNCNFGVVISASHNLFEDNGIKFFDGSGGKLSDQLEEQIEAQLAGEPADEILQTAKEIRADLIIMTTDGPDGFLDALRGSTSERVLRQARCPVANLPVGSMLG